jgi:putative SOS response-associated peptidase YedK
MCGRYRLSRTKQIVEAHFSSASAEEDWNPRYNIAPAQLVPVIRQNPKQPIRELSLLRWGLIPQWAKDLSGAATMINARSETAGTEARVPRCVEVSEMLDPSRWILRMATGGKDEAALLL